MLGGLMECEGTFLMTRGGVGNAGSSLNFHLTPLGLKILLDYRRIMEDFRNDANIMNIKTVFLLATGFGVSALSAQKETLPSAPDSVISERPTGLARLYEAPILKFFDTSKADKGSGIPMGTLNYTHVFSSDFDSIDDDVSVDEFSLFAPFASIRVGKGYVIPMISYNLTKFSTDGRTLLSEDSLHQIRMPITYLYEPAHRWIAGGIIMPSFSGDLSNSDNFSFAAALGAGYAYSPELFIFGGIYYSEGFDDSLLVGGPGFIWNFDEDWQAYLLGPRASLSFHVSDDWLLSLVGQYRSPTWNIEADKLGPERNINVSDLRVALRSEHRLGKKLWASATIGYSFLREMEIEDTESNELQTDDIDSGIFVEAGLTLRF